MFGRYTAGPRNLDGRRALELYNEVQLIRETGWTLAQLEETPEDFVWALTQVLSLEGEKSRDDDDDMRRRYPPPR